MKNKKHIKMFSLVLFAVFLFTLVVTASFAAENNSAKQTSSSHENDSQAISDEENMENQKNDINENDHIENEEKENTFDFQGINYKIISENAANKTGSVSVWNNQRYVGKDLQIPRAVWNNGICFTVVEISKGAFKSNTSLKGEIKIADSITLIDDDAFNGSAIDGQLFISDSVIKIGDRAFKNTRLLKNGATIGSRVEQIGESAFLGSGIRNFIFMNADQVPEIGEYAFSDLNAFAHVPINLEEDYTSSLAARGILSEKIKTYSNDDAKILEFAYDGVIAEIDEENKEIVLVIADGQDLAKLKPTVTYIGKGILPSAQMSVDFSSQNLYTITSFNANYYSEYKVSILSAPLIIKQPQSVEVSRQANVSFEVVAQGNPLSYQWKVSKDDGKTWDDVIDNDTAQTARLQISDASENLSYYCVIKNGISTVDSVRACLVIGIPASIEGPQIPMELEFGYESTSSLPFFLKGSNPISLSVDSNNDKITWNTAVFRLSVEEGLLPGNYQSTILVDNSFGEITSFDYEVIVRPKTELNNYDVLEELSEFSGKGNLETRIDASCDKFFQLLIDGEVIDKVNYSIRSGSTIITLNESYLNSLQNGDYTLSAIFFDGQSDMQLNINAPVNKERKQKNNKTKDEMIAPASLPQNNNKIWINIAIVSLVSAALSIALLKIDSKR